jgi:hypothetical protein
MMWYGFWAAMPLVLGFLVVDGIRGMTAANAVSPVAVSPVTGAEPVTEGAPPVTRRLTAQQFRNGIAATFGPEILVRGRLEPDQRVDGLVAVGSGRASISPAGFAQYLAIGQDIAAQVTDKARRDALVGCQPKDVARFDEACARRFLSSSGMKLFRRPLEPAELKMVMRISRDSTVRLGDFYGGLRYGLASMLASPNFLFRMERMEPDPAHSGALRLDAYSKAGRLSFLLTNGPPDSILLASAQSGALQSPEELRTQAKRLIASPQFAEGVRAFFWDMLDFDSFAALTKDTNQFPGFNRQVAFDAQEQTLRVINNELVVKGGDYRALFTDRSSFVSRRLGSIYSLPVAAQTGFEPQTFPNDSGRSGILTDVSFLALHSHPGRTSPTLRGKFVREAFLCQQIPPPPAGVDFSVVENQHNALFKTAKDRLVAHRSEKSCSGCHKLMDPIGLALEGFDAQGGRRVLENGVPIDMTGDIDGTSFQDATGLGQVLTQSPRLPACLARNVYRYGTGRNPAPNEKDWLGYLSKAFVQDGYKFTALMERVATSEAFYHVVAQAPAHAAPVSQKIAMSAVRKGAMP